MIRILFFIVLVLALAAGFAWLADRPGEMVLTFGGYQYRVTLMVAAVALVSVVAAVMIGWWLIKSIWNSPYTISRYFRVRRRDRGYQALSTGMIAAGAGDAALARKLSRQASKFISSDQEPLIHLLDAQTLLIEGDHAAARKKFEAMLDDPEMRLLGLRGLYLEAVRLGEKQAARHYAAQAAVAAPQLGWAADATLEERTEKGDWDGALKLLEAQRSAGHIGKDVANRRRAVLLTAKAMEALEGDPVAAKNAAIEANRLAPDLVPAAVVAGKASFRQNDTRRGAKILEAAWKLEPHPDIADAYVHARPGDATGDRLYRAKKLEAQRLNHPESSLAVARAALDAGDFKLARESAEAAIRMQPREGAYLVLADIEEAETGDQGRVRQWLGRAVRAPRDPAWVADGYESATWAPASPVTGQLDAFEWKVPVERLGALIGPEEDPVALPPTPLPKPAGAIEDEPIEAEVVQAAVPSPASPSVPPDAPPDVPAAKAPAPVTADPAEPPHQPDDPGVIPEDEKAPSRFRLF
ncbi:MAG: heme biosynthesis protein HemY [Rhizobiaceae bacterium]